MKLTLKTKKECNQKRFGQALGHLATAAAPIRQQILKACARCVSFDGRMTEDEGFLLWMLAQVLSDDDLAPRRRVS